MLSIQSQWLLIIYFQKSLLSGRGGWAEAGPGIVRESFVLFGDWSSHCEQSEAQSLVLTSGGSAGVLPQREAGRAGGHPLGIRRARGDVWASPGHGGSAGRP